MALLGEGASKDSGAVDDDIFWLEQNSGIHAWQMLYWRTVQTIEWSWPLSCDDSDTLASMRCGPRKSVPRYHQLVRDSMLNRQPVQLA